MKVKKILLMRNMSEKEKEREQEIINCLMM